jgi:energy-coupling factor transport system permease protein
MSLSSPGRTGGVLERAHPGAKIIALVLAFAPPFLASGPLEILSYFALLLAASFFSGAGPSLLRVWRLMVILFVMSLVLWTFFQRGSSPPLRLGPLAIHREGVLLGLAVGLRLNCFVIAAAIFLNATPIEDFTFGLTALGLPFTAGFALSLAFRLTPLFIETGQTIAMAQRARGLDLDSGGPLGRLRRYAPILAPVLLCGLRRSDQLAIALESKGFGSSGKRTSLSEFQVGWRDFVLIFSIILVCAVLAIRRLAGN